VYTDHTAAATAAATTAASTVAPFTLDDGTVEYSLRTLHPAIHDHVNVNQHDDGSHSDSDNDNDNALYESITSAGSVGISVSDSRTQGQGQVQGDNDKALQRLLHINKVIRVCSYSEDRYVAAEHAKEWMLHPASASSMPVSGSQRSTDGAADDDDADAESVPASSSSTTSLSSIGLPPMSSNSSDRTMDTDTDTDAMTIHPWSTVASGTSSSPSPSSSSSASSSVVTINDPLLLAYESTLYTLLSRHPCMEESNVVKEMKAHFMTPAECHRVMKYMLCDRKLICRVVKGVRYWYTNPLWAIT
jgi:hypothetical protein